MPDIAGVHADIGHLRAVLEIDVVVDGDERDAGLLGLLGDHGAQRLVGHDDGDALHAVADHGVEGRDREVGVELHVLIEEGDTQLLGLGLGPADLGHEPGVLAHLVDVADLDRRIGGDGHGGGAEQDGAGTDDLTQHSLRSP